MKKEIMVHNIKEWEQVIALVLPTIKPSSIICLKGELGSGKTTLTKLLGQKLKVKDVIVSPTFNIVNIYQSIRGPIYHIDAYRLKDAVDHKVFEEYLTNEGIKIIEWPQNLNIKNPSIEINIEVMGLKRRVVVEWF